MDIRLATETDMPALVAMGERFFAHAGMAKFIPAEEGDIERGLAWMVAAQGQHAVVLVAEQGGQLVGGIVGVCTNPWFAPSRWVVSELAWWVDPEHRTGRAGLKLLAALEDWAKGQGACAVALSDLDITDGPDIRRLVELKGYTLIERSHVKAMQEGVI